MGIWQQVTFVLPVNYSLTRFGYHQISYIFVEIWAEKLINGQSLFTGTKSLFALEFSFDEDPKDDWEGVEIGGEVGETSQCPISFLMCWMNST